MSSPASIAGDIFDRGMRAATLAQAAMPNWVTQRLVWQNYLEIVLFENGHNTVTKVYSPTLLALRGGGCVQCLSQDFDFFKKRSC